MSSSSVGWVSKSEFNDNIIPSVGDKLVQMGNTTDTLRQGVIVITSVDNKPNISIYDGVNSASFDGKLTTRLGDLSGISFNGKDLSGYGLWGENVHLHGNLILSSTNKSVSDSLKDVGNGRNLLLGTNRGVENWVFATALDKGKYSMLGIDKSGAKGIQIIKRTTEESSWGEVLMFPLRPQFITKDKTYHISFDLMQSANQTAAITFNLSLRPQNGSESNALNNTIKVTSRDVGGIWRHHDYEFTTIRSGSETIGQLIYFGITKQNNPDGWVDFAIANLKLEEGVKATEWSQAPEDIEQAMTEFKVTTEGLSSRVSTTEGKVTQIEQNAENISLKVDNLNDGLTETGIDIEKNVISVTTKQFEVKNNQTGEITASIDEFGNLTSNSITAKRKNDGNKAITLNYQQDESLKFYHSNGIVQLEFGWDGTSLMRYYNDQGIMLWKIGDEQGFIPPSDSDNKPYEFEMWKIADLNIDWPSVINLARGSSSNAEWYYQGKASGIVASSDSLSQDTWINGYYTKNIEPQEVDGGLNWRFVEKIENGKIIDSQNVLW